MERYEIKDVLFGLRTEYLRIQKDLDSIEKLLILEDGDSINYSIILDKKKNISDLKLDILKRQSFIVSLIQRLGINVNQVNENRIEVHKLEQGGEHGLIIGDTRFIELPEISNEIFFLTDKVLDNILVNDSPRKIKIVKPYMDDIAIKREINISPLGLNIHSWEYKEDYGNVPSEFVSYVMDSDSINYASYPDLAMSPSLEDCLHTSFDSSLLTKVEKDIIDKSNVRNKRLIVDSYNIIDEQHSFNIEDKEDEIVLVRK